MLPLNRLLHEGLRRYQLEKGVTEKRSVSLWEAVAGPSVAAVTHADNIYDGILYVFTRSSAWSQELSLLKEPLIARINAELGAEAVRDIRFQVKRFPKPADEPRPPAPARELTPAEREALKTLAQGLDEALGARLASIAERQMRGQAPDRACPDCGGPLHGDESRCPFCQGA